MRTNPNPRTQIRGVSAMTQLKGILPALVTPFDKAGNVNYDMLG